MKFNSKLWMLAVALATVGCQDDLENGPVTGTEGVDGPQTYMTVSINSETVTKAPQGEDGKPAGGEGEGTYLGTENEYKVSDVAVVLYRKSDGSAFSSTENFGKDYNLVAFGYSGTVGGMEASNEDEHQRQASVTIEIKESGLEFDNVILTGFDDKFLENIIKWNKDEEQATSLAMRLFYVACTRAKNRLIITYKNKVSKLFPKDSANYIEIAPEDLLSICNQNVEESCTENSVINNLSKSIVLNKDELMTYFHKAITESEIELDIHSPWLTEKVVDELFVDKLARLLQKKIFVKISYGIQDDKQTKHKNYSTENVIKKLKNQLKRYDNFKIEKTNSHGKMLLCDKKFAIIGSFNWLSYDGASDRDEIGCLITDVDEINKLRNVVFNF